MPKNTVDDQLRAIAQIAKLQHEKAFWLLTNLDLEKVSFTTAADLLYNESYHVQTLAAAVIIRIATQDPDAVNTDELIDTLKNSHLHCRDTVCLILRRLPAKKFKYSQLVRHLKSKYSIARELAAELILLHFPRKATEHNLNNWSGINNSVIRSLARMEKAALQTPEPTWQKTADAIFKKNKPS
ncbi:MAG: hypothetical protein NUV82_04280 [Candidatus Komeilibacteria bacterium]|nr:hypothetical protein [Candidatus Komeilibacteria bacterium]